MGPDPKFEERLYHSPDWFEGHQSVFTMLHLMQLYNAAHAVKDRCCIRLRSLPHLVDLRFPNGTALVPTGVKKWLLEMPSSKCEASQVESSTGPLDNGFVKSFDALLAGATSPRQEALAKVSFAKQSAQNKYISVAKLITNQIYDDMTNTRADVWDADLFSDVTALKDQLLP